MPYDPVSGAPYGTASGFQAVEDSGVTPILFAPLSASGAGQTAAVAAVTGKKIRVIGFLAFGTGTTPTVVFQDGSTALTGAMPLSSTPINPQPQGNMGLFETSYGNALNITLAGTTPAITGFLVYVLH